VEIGEKAYNAPKTDAQLTPQQRTARAIHCAASGNVAEVQCVVDLCMLFFVFCRPVERLICFLVSTVETIVG
jgi:hypothetical protein